MKTPEEWIAKYNGDFVSSVVAINRNDIAAIQLDAEQSRIVKGLEIAAKLVTPEACFPDCGSLFCEGRDWSKHAILIELTKRKKELEDKR